MTIMKTLPMIEKPSHELHELMVKQGFSRQQREGELEYSIQFHDASSASLYRLVIPLKSQENTQQETICLGNAYVSNGGSRQAELMDSVREAARSKLAEVADYLISDQANERHGEQDRDEGYRIIGQRNGQYEYESRMN